MSPRNDNHPMDRVRILRQKAGLTQAQLAERAGIEQGYLSRVERGKHSPSLEVTYRLAAALGVRPGDLFEPDGIQKRVQEVFGELAPEQQEAALSVLEAFVAALPKPSKE